MTVRCRKSIYELDSTELNNLRSAMQAIKTSGVWDWFVQAHAQSMNRPTPLPPEAPDISVRNAAHRGPAFLPWHRHFIKQFEEALQVEDPTVMLPYWPWEEDGDLPDPTTAQILTTAYMGARVDIYHVNLLDASPSISLTFSWEVNMSENDDRNGDNGEEALEEEARKLSAMHFPYQKPRSSEAIKKALEEQKRIVQPERPTRSDEDD